MSFNDPFISSNQDSDATSNPHHNVWQPDEIIKDQNNEWLNNLKANKIIDSDICNEINEQFGNLDINSVEQYIQASDNVTIKQKYRAYNASLKYIELSIEDVVNSQYIDQLGLDFCKSHQILPLDQQGARILVCVVDPDNLVIIDEVSHKLKASVKLVITTDEAINRVIDELAASSGQDQQDIENVIGDMHEDEVEIVESKEEDLDLEKIAEESPIIRYVNYLISNAVKERASDIHIEPQEKVVKIRLRIDGILFESVSPPIQMHAAIISRLKIMANLDISERRLPQDGRIRAMIHGRKLDLRLSTLPTASGEKAVLRILDTQSIQVTLNQLGMDEEALTIWKRQIDQPHGIILVTGPTGSGKTTTLYSSLGQMNREKLNISTVEDPVEYHLGGINQTQVHERIGMSFSAALRSLLRQDPDVIMVGEIRDTETARIAIQASLTGHLVLSTLHTNDAPSSVTRLINIGVEPYLIGASVNATLAQRLVRKICDHCKTQIQPTDAVSEHLAMYGIGIDQIWQGEGCDKCRGTGYSGRVGIYELLVMNDNLRDKISNNPNVSQFRRMCIESGMTTLREDGLKKVVKGFTTVEEVMRVTEKSI
ncbi:Type II secretion system protein E [Poriferisphaera corsica]|uniref:Type II secretion system protein E n=1 Tax=Poriferisphaera corsica TaxID=2528020 RepID=A0A517YUZ6_9BACT|nr:GspE/PulE family protein [Poriferisphaera corsica]QDU33972.1 Type II secretion system protein E [Poriferisphaera corsica]